MSTGIPVACAKAGALPEFAKDCAIYFNPDDIEDFSKAIETILTQQDLREKLINAGIQWTKRFSWEKTLERTAEVIQMIKGRCT